MEPPLENSPPPRRPALTDSPWYWLMWFSLIGLVGLQMVDYKYRQRQAQIERQHQARQWTQLDRQAAETAEIEYSTPERTIITLGPLRVLLSLLLLSATAGMVLEHIRHRARTPSREESK